MARLVASRQLDDFDAPADAQSGSDGIWPLFTRIVAVGAIVILAMRVTLPQGLTVGLIVGGALLPIWFSSTRRYSGARFLLAVGLAAIVWGIVLTQFSRVDHNTSTSATVTYSLLMAGFLFGVGVIIWGRTLISDGAVAMWYGIGMLLGVSPGSALFASNPWRFGFSVAITILLLGIASMIGRRVIELSILIALTGASALTDARSSFAILLLTAVLVGWQMRPIRRSRKGSAAIALIGIGLIAVVVYNLGQALILDGYLGQSTQERSLAQLDASGSLILGGRPELAATAALMQNNPWGFGSGVQASLQDILVAKTGMLAINYQPDNGYVERYMFGSGFELHSVVGDLWANFGIVGLIFAGAILFLVLRGLGTAIANNTASALLIYLGAKTLWNLMFAPFYSSVILMMLLMGLVLLPKVQKSVSSARSNLLTVETGQRAAPV